MKLKNIVELCMYYKCRGVGCRGGGQVDAVVEAAAAGGRSMLQGKNFAFLMLQC